MSADPAAHTAEAIDAVAAALGPQVRRDEPLSSLTTYRAGGRAALFCRVESERQLTDLCRATSDAAVDLLVIGKGSNLLVSDGGFAGLAIVLGHAFAAIEVEDADRDRVTVRAGGAAALPVVARRTAAAGLTGLEWAVGVPGSVGGAVRMNAGGHGSDMAASLLGVRVVDLSHGEDHVVPASALDLAYRSSAIAPSDVVAWAELGLVRGDRGAAEEEIASIVRWRRANQPGGPNAGSVFTNPPGDSAGRLIEAAGGKGLRHGSAAVSTRHANFIQVDEGGAADDVFALMVALHRLVRERTGIALHPETRLVGFGRTFAEAVAGA